MNKELEAELGGWYKICCARDKLKTASIVEHAAALFSQPTVHNRQKLHAKGEQRFPSSLLSRIAERQASLAAHGNPATRRLHRNAYDQLTPHRQSIAPPP